MFEVIEHHVPVFECFFLVIIFTISTINIIKSAFYLDGSEAKQCKSVKYENDIARVLQT